jgi:hypothetical protein
MKPWLACVVAVVHAADAADSFATHAAERDKTQTKRCGWVRGLKQSGEPITYERAPTGLADIFSSMVTAFWYAALAGRPLAAHWPESINTIELPRRALRNKPHRLNANETYFKRTHEAFKETLGKRIRNADWPSAPWALSGNRGMTQWLFDHQRPALNASGVEGDAIHAAGCVLHHLAKPHAAAYAETIAPLLEKIDKARTRGPVVCIHARTGLMPELRRNDGGKRSRPDDEMHGTRSTSIGVDDVRGVVACAQEAEQEAGGKSSWFVAADSASLRADFLKRFPGKIVLADWAPDPFASYQVGGGSRGGGRRRPGGAPDPRAMRAALARTFAEWYALSRCDYLVASRSGFSRTAAAVAVAARGASVRYVGRLAAPCRRADAGSPMERLLVSGGAGL